MESFVKGFIGGFALALIRNPRSLLLTIAFGLVMLYTACHPVVP